MANSLDSVNAEAARIAKKVDAVVAIGHLGATAGTLTAPTGPLMDLANGVSNVDAVIGDHTDQQVLTTTASGVLVTENRSKGLRFTRVRLVIGPGKEGVVYKTADFHKPFDIGVTPNAADPGEDRRAERSARRRSSTRRSASRRSSSRAPTRARRRPAAWTAGPASR